MYERKCQPHQYGMQIQIVRNRFVYQIRHDLFLTLKTLLANVELNRKFYTLSVRV